MNARRRQLLIYSLLGILPSGAKAACTLTEPNSLGPFYRRAAPFRALLASPTEPGQELRVSGRVLGADACSPLSDAIVDVWHANEAGGYYDVGAEASTSPAQFRLRGRVRTNALGEYSFQTILPGAYGGRPKHIHYVISHPKSEPFVTQLYFEGDPRLADDFLVRDSLIMPLEAIGKTASKTHFDIVLET